METERCEMCHEHFIGKEAVVAVTDCFMFFGHILVVYDAPNPDNLMEHIKKVMDEVAPGEPENMVYATVGYCVAQDKGRRHEEARRSRP